MGFAGRQSTWISLIQPICDRSLVGVFWLDAVGAILQTAMMCTGTAAAMGGTLKSAVKHWCG